MKYSLADLVDIPRLQELTDRLYDAAGIPCSIVTTDGEILTGSGWQSICTDFHRKHPEIEQDCIKSDIAIRKKIGKGEPFCMYTCPRGLTDGSVPIVIEGEHLANAFVGQLFLEEPGEDTEESFKEQARHFGMDEEAYVEALREVPVVPVEKFRASLLFLANLAEMIASQGLQRKQELEAQERLRQSEEKYRTLFENMAQGVFYQRADGSLVDCNPALLEMFGLTADEFFGRTSMHPEWRVFSEDGKPVAGDQHPSMQALETGKPVRDAVLRVFNPRLQEDVWLVVNAYPQFDAGDDKPYQVFVTLHDITEQKRADAAVKKSRDTFEEAQAVAKIGSWDYDVAAGKPTWSKELFRIFGVDPGNGEPSWEEHRQIFHPDDWMVLDDAVRKAVSEGLLYDLEFRIVHPDGNVNWAQTLGRPVRNERGEVVRLVGTVQDITERRLAEERLWKISALLEETEKTGRIGGWEFNPLTMAQTWTDEVFRILEIDTAQEAPEVPQGLGFLAPSYRKMAETAVQRAIEFGEPFDQEWQVITAKGKTRWVHSVGRVIESDGRIVSIRGSFQDITDRKQAEQELRRFEWLLEKEEPHSRESVREYRPAYQDPTQLNTARVILDGIGREALDVMAGDLLDLLDTSVAIYEANGDYAHGVFESGWCRMMDGAGFKLCGTDDTAEALACGKWLCHENCWNDSAKAAIETGEVTDIECVGGIRLYGVPIQAGDEIIGAVNVGYSTPPRADEALLELSEKFQVDYEELRAKSLAYKPRPPFIIDVAKRNCHAVAKMIGQTIERQRAKASLSKKEAHHRTLVETIPDLVWLKDPNGVYLSCNRTFERFFGAKEAEIVGKTDYDFVDTEKADFFRHHDRRAMDANGPVINEEWLTFAADGYRGLFETVKTPMIDNEGNIVGVMGIARDITERNQIQDDLKAIANEQSWLLGSMINAFVIFESVFDEAGDFTSYRFEYINKAYEEITGIRLEDVRGKTVHEVWPETEDSWIENYGRVATTGEPMTFNMYHNPTEKLYHCHAYRPWEKRNKFCVVFEDITEQKRVEEEKEKLEQQLSHSQKMESIGRLAGGVAHDFNNLLTVITNYCGLVAGSLAEHDPMRADVDEIRHAADRAAELTRQLLAFSRKQILRPRVIDINASVSRSEKMLQRIIGEDINLVFVPAPDLLRTRFDPGQAEQILFNLAANARDAMPRGGQLTLKTQNILVDSAYQKNHPHTETGHYAMLAVSDTGIGMDEHTRARVFDPFFTTKEVGEGTGLGLSTVYGIVKQHGGSVDVTSEVGEGTTFMIYLPAVDEAAEVMEAPTETATAHGDETILLIEDDTALRRVALRILEKHGFNVLEAANGGEALLLCESHKGPIDLVLTDVVMPGMSGRECFERLTTIRSDLQVLFMSGYNEDAIAHCGVLNKGTRFLQKPFTLEGLLSAVRKALDQPPP